MVIDYFSHSCLKMCKICLKRTLDATFLDCVALTFCDIIGELLPEWACLTLQGGTDRIYHHTVVGTRESHPSVHDLQIHDEACLVVDVANHEHPRLGKASSWITNHGHEDGNPLSLPQCGD